MYQMGDVIHGLAPVVIPYYAIKKVVWMSCMNDVNHFLLSNTQGERCTKWMMSFMDGTQTTIRNMMCFFLNFKFQNVTFDCDLDVEFSGPDNVSSNSKFG